MVLVHAVLGKGLVSPGVDRRAGIEVGGPDLTIPLVHDHLVTFEGKRLDPPPLRALEGRSAFEHLPGLVHEAVDGEGLPAVGVNHGRIARVGYHELVVQGLVVDIGVVEGLIGSILQSERDDLFGDVVAQCGRRTKGVVGRSQGGIVAQCGEQGVESCLRGDHTRGIRVAVAQHPVGSVGRRFLACRGDVEEGEDVFGNAVEFGRVATHGVTEEHGLGSLVVGRPRIVHGQRDMVQVPGVDGRTGEIVPDAHELRLNPLERHIVLCFLRLDGAKRRAEKGQQNSRDEKLTKRHLLSMN